MLKRKVGRSAITGQFVTENKLSKTQNNHYGNDQVSKEREEVI